MIEIQNLTKKFHSVTALQQISCRIDTGSIYGLVGSNGAGKSTLLRVLAGVYRPDGGSVLIDGTPPFEHPHTKGRIFFRSGFCVFFPAIQHGRYRRPVFPPVSRLGRQTL